MWVKALHAGGQEQLSTVAQSQGRGVVFSPLQRYQSSLLVFGTFRGWLKATGTKGLQTPGVDDDGFFNCCLSLRLPNLFDENQDIFETFIMTLTP